MLFLTRQSVMDRGRWFSGYESTNRNKEFYPFRFVPPAVIHSVRIIGTDTGIFLCARLGSIASAIFH